MFLLKILCNLWPTGKCMSTRLRKQRAMFVLTFLLNGGLNQMMLRCLFLRCLYVSCGMYSSLWLKLLCPSAFLHACTASSNTCLSDDSVEMRLLMDVGSCLKKLGGWLECLCMYITDRHWASYKIYVFRQ